MTAESLRRWRGWQRHVLRDQLAIWMPAAFIGLALPSMLSVEFLPRGTTANQWTLAGMTAGGVADRVGGGLGVVCWYLVLICGFLVLLPNAASNADGFIRRWVDVIWTALKRLQTWEPRQIGQLYFALLVVYGLLGVFFLAVAKPMGLIVAYSGFQVGAPASCGLNLAGCAFRWKRNPLNALPAGCGRTHLKTAIWQSGEPRAGVQLLAHAAR